MNHVSDEVPTTGLLIPSVKKKATCSDINLAIVIKP